MDGEDDETFQRQALEIQAPDKYFDPTIKPQTGEEYLTHMLYERVRCPAVVVKRPINCVQKKSLDKDTTSEVLELDESLDASSSLELFPTTEWKKAQSIDFWAARTKVEHMRNQIAAHNYNNSLEPPLTKDSAEWQSFCRKNQPLLSIVLRLSQSTLEYLLELCSEWLGANEEKPPADGEVTQEVCASSSSSAAAAAGVENAAATMDLRNSEQWLGAWLYAILVCLHMPLTREVHSTLRDIARICVRLRNRLQPQELGKAVAYNLFIHLIANSFDQLDLAKLV